MPYALETASLVAQVLGHAVSLSEYRLAGYAANAGFWLDEVRHCFDILDGHAARFQRMQNAASAYVLRYPPASAEIEDTRYTNNIRDAEILAARQDLTDSARAFFLRCAKLRLVPPELYDLIDEQLSLPLYGYEYAPPDDPR